MTVPPWRPFFQTLVEPLFQTPPGDTSQTGLEYQRGRYSLDLPPTGPPPGPSNGSGGLAKILTSDTIRHCVTGYRVNAKRHLLRRRCDKLMVRAKSRQQSYYAFTPVLAFAELLFSTV
jgi:hypothetical protein